METNSTTTVTKVTPKSPIFLIFAEYLGYVSPLITYAEQMIEGKLKSEHMLRCLNVDAESIFRKMCQDYDIKDIRDWWDTYYELGIKSCEDKLNKVLKDINDIPF